jgi:ABC-type nitrate/sulfonate/bicarbonate transport system permease component
MAQMVSDGPVIAEVAPKPSRSRVRTRRTITSVVTLLVAWELAGRYLLTNRLFFAPPSEVLLAAHRLWASGELQTHIETSFTELLVGMALAIMVGVVIGVLQGVSVRIRDYTEIYVTILFATPLVAIAPLLILWMGIGIGSKIVVVLLTAVFPIIINTAAGIRATDAVLIEVARSFCATNFQVITKVLFPSSLPYILAGVRLAVGRGIVGVVVGELFGAQAGLGNLIQTAGQTFDVPALFVGVFTLAGAGVLLTACARFAERHALRWRRSLLED